jgi:hypothetical protein
MQHCAVKAPEKRCCITPKCSARVGVIAEVLPEDVRSCAIWSSFRNLWAGMTPLIFALDFDLILKSVKSDSTQGTVIAYLIKEVLAGPH